LAVARSGSGNLTERHCTVPILHSIAHLSRAPSSRHGIITNSNDFNSLIQGLDGRLYLISHFENRPGAVYQTLLTQESDGTLTPVATRPIDFSGVRGGWVPCAGFNTP